MPRSPRGVRLDREHLVQLDLVGLEAHPRAGHVQAPDPRGALADLGDALVPVVGEVLAPAGQRHRVVLAQVLLVAHLETGVLDLGDDPAGAGQLAVGEDVAVDERAGVLVAVVRAGDAVVQQPAARARACRAGTRSTPGSCRTPMCSVRPIELTASKLALGHVAVVEVPDLGQVVEALALDRLLRPRGLLARTASRRAPYAVLAGGVADHAAPAAADVEQPLPGLQVELAGDQVVLERLRLLQRGVLGCGKQAQV